MPRETTRHRGARETTSPRRAALVASLGLLVLGPSEALATEAGGGAFALRGGSARGAVLGEAYAAAGGDADAIMWNPAALATIGETHLQITYQDVFGLGLARHTSVSFATRPVAEEIATRGDSLYVVTSEATRPVYAASLGVLVVDLGDESYWEFAPTLGFAHYIAPGTAIGASARYLRASSTLDGVSATGYAADAGILQHMPFGARVGVAFRNLLGQLNWKEGGEEPEPRELVASAALPVGSRVTLLGGAASQLGQDLTERWNVATELVALPNRWVFLVGAETRNDGDDSQTRVAAGTRFRVGQVRFDYAFVAEGATPGETHRATLMVLF